MSSEGRWSRDAFLAQIGEDHAAGRTRPLDDYLSLFPGDPEALTREYASVLHAIVGKEPRPAEQNEVGHYHLIRELGRGGQGVVWLAEDVRLRRLVALKVITGLPTGSEDSLLRFRREAEVASQLDHPGICAVYDAGVERGTAWIAMKYVEGPSLTRVIEESGGTHGDPTTDSTTMLDKPGAAVQRRPTTWSSRAPANPPSAEAVASFARIMAKVARALHAAHERGVVHRDVKPGNILLSAGDEPVLVDFGLARADTASLELTRTGVLQGTPHYLAPEIFARKSIKLDRRADIWSLGVTLFECFSGQRPFQAPTREGLYQAILSKDPPALRRLNPAVSKDLATVVATCLQKDRDRRYQTADAVADDLEAAIGGLPISVRPIGIPGRAWRWARREPAKAALAAVLAIALPTIGVLVARHLANIPKIEAADAAQIAISREDALTRGYDELGEGDPHDAIGHFEAAAALPGECPEAAFGIVMAHLKLGEPQRALDVLDAHGALVAGLSAAALLRLDAEAGLAGTNVEGAETMPQRNVPEPRTAIDYFVLGERLLAQGHAGRNASYREALGPLTQAILLSKTPRALYYQERAHAAGHARDLDAARDTARALRLHWPHSEAANYFAGYALERVNMFDEAIDALREAIRIDPRRAASHGSLGTSLRRKGLFDEAIAAHRESVRLDPGHSTWHMNLANALEDGGLFDEAIAEYREAIRIDPQLPDAHNNLGYTLQQRGRVDEALAAYGEALRLSPGYGRARRNKGILLLNSGRAAEAIPQLHEAVRLSPDWPEGHNALGRAFNDEGRLEQAVAELETAIRLRPDYADAHANLGHALCELGRVEDAVAHFRAALRTRTDMPRALCNMSFALREEGEFEAALDAVKRGHELGKSRAGWDLPSGQWLEEAGRLAAEGARFESLATAGEPADPEILARMGRVACFKKRYVLASDWIARSAEAPVFDDLELRIRFHGACASALAGCGQDASDPGDDGPRKRAWRNRALAWLSEEVAALESAALSDRALVPGARRALARALADPRLAVVRDPWHLRRLGLDERLAWEGLWAEAHRIAAALR